jgi:hypothetical protein
MKKLLYPDVGYTPENLKHYVKANGLTRKEFTERLNSIGYDYSLHTVHRWMLPLDSAQHTDMPIRVWDTLLRGGF